MESCEVNFQTVCYLSFSEMFMQKNGEHVWKIKGIGSRQGEPSESKADLALGKEMRKKRKEKPGL